MLGSVTVITFNAQTKSNPANERYVLLAHMLFVLSSYVLLKALIISVKEIQS